MSRITQNKRAAFAYTQVRQTLDTYHENSDEQERFRTYVKKMPTMIQTNGLGQTLAFYFSKGSTTKEYKDIYNIITQWLQRSSIPGIDGTKELVETVIQLDSQHYRLVTIEILELLNWMRKFVDGMVKKNA